MSEKCSVCGRFVDINRGWGCEICEEFHHKECSGESSEGTGEYPSEDAYSICKKCCEIREKTTYVRRRLNHEM